MFCIVLLCVVHLHKLCETNSTAQKRPSENPSWRSCEKQWSFLFISHVHFKEWYHIDSYRIPVERSSVLVAQVVNFPPVDNPTSWGLVSTSRTSMPMVAILDSAKTSGKSSSTCTKRSQAALIVPLTSRNYETFRSEVSRYSHEFIHLLGMQNDPRWPKWL